MKPPHISMLNFNRDSNPKIADLWKMLSPPTDGYLYVDILDDNKFSAITDTLNPDIEY